ncbi:TauD/TfdA family dioxygenase [Microbulbifer sp. GL-2]|uniref:TauD/TfdA family dioxygenase n=1 Tax=Microbulbifer sp. GL-2 TaxID=2591606 RepID=UPI0011637466|nr:TauD/TfdA family dioxygenase [Microbulbifer sp. GL-2]BBM04013.1 hypothetical protein GL2_40870 [Microbulbifer sp. GL-2]
MHYETIKLNPFGVMLKPKSGAVSIRHIEIDLLRELFNKEFFVVLRGFEPLRDSLDFETFSQYWGEIDIWPFGKVLDLIQNEDPDDHIFDNSYMPLHWDGMYRPKIPQYQIFQCVKAPSENQGGKTYFSNTFSALENASTEDVNVWKQVTGTYQRKMEFYNSKVISPIITKHPHREYNVIRYSEPHFESRGKLINPPITRFTGIDVEYIDDFHRSLRKALYSQNTLYAHRWQTDDIVISDNFTLLHGRESFKSKSSRHIRRIQVLSNPQFENPGLDSYQ